MSAKNFKAWLHRHGVDGPSNTEVGDGISGTSEAFAAAPLEFSGRPSATSLAINGATSATAPLDLSAPAPAAAPSAVIQPATGSAPPQLTVTLVQNPSSTNVTVGEVLHYTLTISAQQAANGVDAQSVVSTLTLANETIDTTSIHITGGAATVSNTAATTFQVSATGAVTTSSAPIVVTFNATVNSVAIGQNTSAAVQLNYSGTIPGDEYIYGTDRLGTDGNYFYKYDATTNTLTHVYTNVGADQDSLVFDNAGTAGGIIFSAGGNKIDRYDIGTGVTKTIYTGSGIYDLIVSPDGKTVYFNDYKVASAFNGNKAGTALYKIDISSAVAPANYAATLVIAHVGTTTAGLSGLAFDGTGRLFATYGTSQGYNGGSQIVQVDTATGGILRTATLGSGLTLDGMCYDPTTGHLFVSSFTTSGPNLFEVNPDTMTVVRSLTIPHYSGYTTSGNGPDGMASDGKGNLWIAFYHNSIVKLDIASGSFTVELPSNSGGTSGVPFIDDVVPIVGTGSIGTYTGYASVTDTVVCYTAGTRILTPRGEVAVENLRAGDHVMTVAADGLVARPVRWVGSETVRAPFIDALRHLPVRIKAGALDESLPARDLLVSPAHAVFVDDILVQAGALVNGVSIVREAAMPETFIYYHIELDEHVLLLAEGTPAESFVDVVERTHFDNWAEHEALYPLGHVIEEMPYPRVQSSRQLPMTIKRRLAERATELTDSIGVAA